MKLYVLGIRPLINRGDLFFFFSHCIDYIHITEIKITGLCDSESKTAIFNCGHISLHLLLLTHLHTGAVRSTAEQWKVFLWIRFHKYR